jgi:LysR family transcriptional regulator, chromosome initiation inhibitor
MFDYRGLQALHTVIQTQSFEQAAKQLFITQSAVSQRIKSLESDYGQALLIRTHPYKPTAWGEQLLGHYNRVMILEQNLAKDLHQKINKLSIAINRDSLETWFNHLYPQLHPLSPFTLEMISDDQEVTLNYLKSGLVAAALSTKQQPLTGCASIFLGFMDYVLVASPSFVKHYFSGKKSDTEKLQQAPTVLFDQKDLLHQQFLTRFFNINTMPDQCHYVPSVAGFRQMICHSYAYGLLPKIDIIQELNTGTLVEIYPNTLWEMPLYWHYWAIAGDIYKQLNTGIVNAAKQVLRQ